MVVEPLVISFRVIMSQELSDRRSQRLLTEKDHPGQAFFLDRAHESLQVRVEIRRPRRQSQAVHTILLQDAHEGFRELRIAIEQQVSLAV